MKRKLFMRLSLFLVVSVIISACAYDHSEEKNDTESSTTDTAPLNTEASAPLETIAEENSYITIDTEIPYEFTEQDKELQIILSQIAEGALRYQGFFLDGFVDGVTDAADDGVHEQLIEVFIHGSDEFPTAYTLVSDMLPKTSEELESELRKYFSERIVSERYMNQVAKGEYAENENDGKKIILSDYESFAYTTPTFIELDERLYRIAAIASYSFCSDWSTAKVISQTEEELIFSYIDYYDTNEPIAAVGKLKYEDGWKFDWEDVNIPYESGISETSSDTTPTAGSETSAAENENEIQLNIHDSPPDGTDRGGLFPFEYNGTEYIFNIVDRYDSYIIDKEKNVFDLNADEIGLDQECKIDAVMAEFKDFEYLGKIGETVLGNISFNEADVYKYEDDIILVFNCDNDVRYNPSVCEKLYDIEFSNEERLQLTKGTIDFEKTLQDHGVEYDPSIFFCALLYEPER